MKGSVVVDDGHTHDLERVAERTVTLPPPDSDIQ
jgi:hypothetical protein